LARLGVDSCIHIFAAPKWGDRSAGRGGLCWGLAVALQNLCRAKTASFQNIMPRAQSTDRCCIIQ